MAADEAQAVQRLALPEERGGSGCGREGRLWRLDGGMVGRFDSVWEEKIREDQFMILLVKIGFSC